MLPFVLAACTPGTIVVGTDSADPADSATDSGTDTSETADTADTGETGETDDPIGLLSFTIATGRASGTPDSVTLCVTADACFALDTPDWADFVANRVDVFHVDARGLTRGDIDRVTLSATGATLRPACVAVAANGVPVYTRALDVEVGPEEFIDTTLLVETPGCFGAPVSHGPMVGAVGDTSARVWVRTDASHDVQLRIATTEAGLAAAAPILATPEAGHDFAAELVAEGLRSDTDYAWDLHVAGVRSGPFTLRTAPASTSDTPVRVAFGSCSDDEAQPVFEAVTAEAADLFLFVGDGHYGNTTDLAGQRAWWRWAHAIPERAAFLTATSILATWDDHDYAGDNTRADAPGKADALAAFAEYWPNPDAGTAETPGTFFRWRYGGIELFVLDDRYHHGEDDSILGRAQTVWLLDALGDSTASVKLVVSGSQVTADRSTDSWFGFLEARAALLAAIGDADIEGVVFLSGDVHRHEMRLDPGVGGPAFLEFTSSPLANSSTGCGAADEMFACYGGNGYVVLDITPGPSPWLQARIVDEDGETTASWEGDPTAP